MHRKLRATGWLLLLSALSNATVAASEHPAHEPHVHGIAALNIVLENHDVHLALESPAVNLLGFEHAPVTAEQKTAFHATRQILTGPTRLFALPGAGCQLVDSDIRMPEIHSHTDGDDGHDHHEEHADIHANYHFQCLRIAELNEIRIDLFAIFPGIQQIKAQWVTGRSQGTQLLTPAANRLKIK